MPRNAEVIRQWNLLLQIDAARLGASVDDLAKQLNVTKRTIWRDLDSLQQAGFPLIDEKRDRKTVWRLAAMPLKALTDPGLSLTEICSLYMSRALTGSLVGTPFAPGLTSVLGRIDRVLSPKMRAFLNELPGVLYVKSGPLKRRSEPDYDEIVARLLDASLRRRVVTMRYFSASSNREKDYEIHPYSIAYAEGGLYLTAFVSEYRQVRTFALERIRKIVLLGRGFEPTKDLSGDPFGHSLGVHRGRPEKIEIEFAARVAPLIRERTWHNSQQLRNLSNGGVRMTLRVTRDYALRAWILGFGAHARVVAPSSLAEEILEQLEEARDGYIPKPSFDAPAEVDQAQRTLFRTTH